MSSLLCCCPGWACSSILGAHVFAHAHARCCLLASRDCPCCLGLRLLLWWGTGVAVIRVAAAIAPHHGAGGSEQLVQGRGGSGRVLVLPGKSLEASSPRTRSSLAQAGPSARAHHHAAALLPGGAQHPVARGRAPIAASSCCCCRRSSRCGGGGGAGPAVAGVVVVLAVGVTLVGVLQGVHAVGGRRGVHQPHPGALLSAMLIKARPGSARCSAAGRGRVAVIAIKLRDTHGGGAAASPAPAPAAEAASAAAAPSALRRLLLPAQRSQAGVLVAAADLLAHFAGQLFLLAPFIQHLLRRRRRRGLGLISQNTVFSSMLLLLHVCTGLSSAATAVVVVAAAAEAVVILHRMVLRRRRLLELI